MTAMKHWFFFLACLLWVFHAHADEPRVVVTIKPLHSLVAGVMAGSGYSPALLVDGKASLHEFALKPSQASLMRHADIIFYMGEGFEQFLHKIVPQLPASTRVVSMEQAEGLLLYPPRFAGHNHEEHNHEGHSHEGAHDEVHDMHVWMSPANARAMVKAIAQALSARYPSHAALFARNALAMDTKLAALDQDLHARMAKLSGKPFVVFHDAYQYFDRAYRMNNIGSIALHPEQPLSAKRVQALRKQIMSMKAACVFREPQFEGRVVDNIMQGTGAKSAILDPEGALLAPGPDLYFKLMDGIASQMESCLTSAHG